MEFLVDIFGSAGFGTLLGGVLGIFKTWQEKQTLKLKFDHEIGMIKAKTEASIKASELAIQEATVAGKLLVEQLETKAFIKGQETSEFGNNVRAVVRPLILLFTAIMMTWIFVETKELVGGLKAMDKDYIQALFKICVLTFVTMFSMAGSFYFCQRPSKGYTDMVHRTLK